MSVSHLTTAYLQPCDLSNHVSEERVASDVERNTKALKKKPQ